MKREAFGKTLIEQPVVRHKFGHMARQVDGYQAWVESIIWEMDHLSHEKGKLPYQVQRSLTKTRF